MKMTHFHVLCHAVVRYRQKEKFVEDWKISVFLSGPFEEAAPLSYLVSGLECERLKPVWRLEWALPETVGGGKSLSPPKEEEPRKANIHTTCSL